MPAEYTVYIYARRSIPCQSVIFNQICSLAQCRVLFFNTCEHLSVVYCSTIRRYTHWIRRRETESEAKRDKNCFRRASEPDVETVAQMGPRGPCCWTFYSSQNLFGFNKIKKKNWNRLHFLSFHYAVWSVGLPSYAFQGACCRSVPTRVMRSACIRCRSGTATRGVCAVETRSTQNFHNFILRLLRMTY